MIVPGELDITIFQGVSWDMPVEWLINNERYDFTDQVVWMQIRPDYDSGVIIGELSIANGAITVLDDGFSLMLALTGEQTALYPLGRYVYDMKVLNTPSSYRPLKGKCYVDPGVTR